MAAWVREKSRHCLENTGSAGERVEESERGHMRQAVGVRHRHLRHGGAKVRVPLRLVGCSFGGNHRACNQAASLPVKMTRVVVVALHDDARTMDDLQVRRGVRERMGLRLQRMMGGSEAFGLASLPFAFH